MHFKPTPLEGAFLIEIEKKEDERGFFARTFCSNELRNIGLETTIVQINNSLSKKAGTLRGIHYQLSPKAETKIIRCISGSIFDLIIDLRPDSPSYLKHYGAQLDADNRSMMYVPKGFGHAFLTLEPDTEVIYMVSEFYSPEHERGLRWNDPRFAIEWPITPVVISDKDKIHPDFDPSYHLTL